MSGKNILNIASRSVFREWLMQNADSETECWVPEDKFTIPVMSQSSHVHIDGGRIGPRCSLQARTQCD